MDKSRWGRIFLWTLPLVAVTAAWGLFEPHHQPLKYHQFADKDAVLGIPNFANVTSNLAFLLAGGLGLYHCIRRRPSGALAAWVIFFTGFVLVAFGSAYYHANPNNQTLVWDRLAMSVGFAAIYAALIAEYVAPRLEKYLLVPALAVAMASVVYWGIVDDLRFYFAAQGTVFVTALVILFQFDSAHGQKRHVLAALLAYGLAILCEQLDHQIYELTREFIGGHAIKHLFAALAAYVVYLMLRRRA